MNRTTNQKQAEISIIYQGLLDRVVQTIKLWSQIVFKPKMFFEESSEVIENGAGLGVFCFVLGRVPSLLLLSFYLFEGPRILKGVDFDLLGASRLIVLPLFGVIGAVVLQGIYFFASYAIAKALGGKGLMVENGSCFCCSLAPSIFDFIPLVSFFIPFYEAYILALGFMRFHNLSRRRAFIAAFLPLFILVSISFIFIVMLAVMMIEQIV